jgi:hypothetical protein
MRGLLLISFTAATAFATATVFAPHPAQAIITPTGLRRHGETIESIDGLGC